MTDTQIGSATQLGLDDFLGHSNRGSTSYLGNWKKNNPPRVRVVLHTQAPIIALWQNPWPKIVTREKDGREVREVWSGSFNSWEVEKILNRQYRRDDDGERLFPPVVCPMALMLEEVERLMRDDTLKWDTPMFRFVGDDESKARVLHAASMTNKLKKIWGEMTNDEKQDALARGIPSPAKSWMAMMMAKCQYVFTVVDYDNAKDGIQVAKQTTLVGDKTKTAIRDRRTSLGEVEGNPLTNPVVIQWEYDQSATTFGEKYSAVIIDQLPIPSAGDVMDLITKKDPPNLDHLTAPGDIVALRASMEDAYCGPAGMLDFDAIFAPAEAIAGIPADSDEDADDIAADIVGDAEDGAAEDAALADDIPDGGVLDVEGPDYLIADRKDDGRVYAADGVELFTCEACGAIMRGGEDKCRKCGEEYGDDEEVDAVAEAAPPPPPSRKRKDSKSKTAKAKAGKTASQRAKAAGGDKVDF